MTLAFFGAALAVSMLFGVLFVVILGPPWRNESPSVAWLQVSVAALTVAIDLIFFLALFRVHVPLWIVAGLLLGQDGVFIWRVRLLLNARKVDA